MASTMRMGYLSPDDGGSALARNFDVDRQSFKAFRNSAEVDYAHSLSTLIEHEIIPRLVVAHTNEAPAIPSSGSVDIIDPGEVEALAPLALQVEADALLTHVEAILARGVSVDTVMVDLLAPTARLLGEFWDDDRCDFMEVTMGLWRLQEVVHEIANLAPPASSPADGRHRALFASFAGDQHSFGAIVIDELFRRNGWATERMNEVETNILLQTVTDFRFDLIGLTVSCDYNVAHLPSIIAALRNVSRNSRVCVMVGGRAFSENPELAAQVGADGTAPDAKLALSVAEALVRDREAGAVAGS